MLMALDPNVKELCVFDLSVAMVPPAGVAADLGHLERKSDVKGYVMEVGQKPIDNLKECLTGCDLVLVPAGMPRKPGMTRDDLFKVNADIAKGIVEACAKFCPEAVLGLIVNPVNSIVPAMAELYKKKGLDPLKIVGITTLDVVRANKFSGEITGKNPNYINARGTEGPLFPESRPLSTGVPRVAVGSSSGFVAGFEEYVCEKLQSAFCGPALTSEQLQVARRAEKGLAKSSSGIQAEKKYDGILDELEEAAVIQEQDEGEEGEEEEDSWKGIKETFGWVLVADVFIIIGLSIWLIVGFALAQLFNIDQVYLAFTNLWDPYIQSLIGILFGGRRQGELSRFARANSMCPASQRATCPAEGSQTFHHEIRIMLSSTSLCTCQLRSVSCHVSRVWSELRALHGTTERRLVAKTIDAEKIPDLDKRACTSRTRGTSDGRTEAIAAGTDVVNAKSGKGSATLSMAYAGPA
ncbi:unnamed protein product [Durusdinium trenchii]|uniref:malate dehydrogenase n=1 Tax=Durusdinium trenchii TaxID=1381693 RepID=A0ABP0JAQ0_9DINO